jgi:hypothetical protein
MDLLWGSAGKVFKFDGRQQAVERYVPASIEQRFCMGSEFSFSDFFTNIFVD